MNNAIFITQGACFNLQKRFNGRETHDGNDFQGGPMTVLTEIKTPTGKTIEILRDNKNYVLKFKHHAEGLISTYSAKRLWELLKKLTK